MYRLHIANKNYSSWSLRPWLLLKVLDIPFEELLHPFPEQGAWDSYRQFSPNGKVPCLEDQEIIVWDSLAIAEYLQEEGHSVWPRNKPARAWARSVSAEMHSGFQALRQQCSMNCGLRVRLHEITAALQKDMDRIEEIWAEGLQNFGGPYLGGSSFTAVDAFFAPVVFRVQTYQLSLDPVSQDYMQWMLKLPAMLAWYEAALAETFRERGHEKDSLDVGTVTLDLRKP